LVDKIGLTCQKVPSGPMGGDAQIAALVAQGLVKAVIFLVDPLTAHPHDPDIQTVLRVCDVHNVPIATNVPAADLFLASDLLVSHEAAGAVPPGRLFARPQPTSRGQPMNGCGHDVSPTC